MVLHCISLEVHCPLMHVKPFEHEIPSSLTTSLGHEAEDPVQRSSGSHSPVEGRQTWSVPENWQLLQQSSLESSHTELFLNLHVAASQQLFPAHLLFSVTKCCAVEWGTSYPSDPPQSQSSPVSTIPFPHLFSVIICTSLLSVKHCLLTLLEKNAPQMLPMVQGLNLSICSDVEGFMMYLPPASHWVAVSWQHCEESCIFAAHWSGVQSWTAPNVCPTSWAITFHSEGVLATTFAPLTVWPSALWSAVSLHNIPIQASPTAEPVLQFVNKVQNALPSEALSACPRQSENKLRRSVIVVELPQGIFHWALEGAVPGHDAPPEGITSDLIPKVMLKVLSKTEDL